MFKVNHRECKFGACHRCRTSFKSRAHGGSQFTQESRARTKWTSDHKKTTTTHSSTIQRLILHFHAIRQHTSSLLLRPLTPLSLIHPTRRRRPIDSNSNLLINHILLRRRSILDVRLRDRWDFAREPLLERLRYEEAVRGEPGCEGAFDLSRLRTFGHGEVVGWVVLFCFRG